VDGPVFKIENDPRCTPVGRLMRKFSLDELPNLLISSWVICPSWAASPLPEEVEKYERWQRRACECIPTHVPVGAGRTQQAQLSRWMELDLEYIDHWSMALDWKIILKTVPIVLLGRGAS